MTDQKVVTYLEANQFPIHEYSVLRSAGRNRGQALRQLAQDYGVEKAVVRRAYGRARAAERARSRRDHRHRG